MGSITIVIPTHNRYDKLRSLLRSIGEFTTDEVDSVLVVDDSTEQVDLRSEFPDIELHQISTPQRLFMSRSKNLGWKYAKTEFVYFIDDDNMIDQSTITPLYVSAQASERIGAVMPAVLYRSRPDLVWVYATPFLNSRLRHNLVGRNLPRDSALEGRLLRTDALPNASLVRRQALVDVGGFDERLVVNSSMDLAVRLKEKGWRVLANTGAFIYHDVEPPGKIGWWAAHGSADPERVRYEIRDWFLIMRRLHGDGPAFALGAVLESSRFVLPNLFAYMLRGEPRRALVQSLLIGYLEGLVSTGP